MRLIHKHTREEVKVGDMVKGTTGLDQTGRYEVLDFHRNGKSTTPDRVVIDDPLGGRQEWLPGVFDLEIVD
jgi:hypothetical protein